MSTVENFAEEITGREYPFRVVSEFSDKAKKLGLVIAYGMSDNLLELRGAVVDEIGAFGGTVVNLDPLGLVVNRCDEGDRCPNWRRSGVPLILIWHDEEESYNWTIETEIPHAKFVIFVDGIGLSQGIVFSLADAGR